MLRIKSVFTLCLLFSALTLASLYSISSHAQSCFPTCSSTDGRFLAVTEGILFATLTPDTLNVRLVIPSKVDTFQLGIFDGDHLNGANGQFHWDNGDPMNPGTYDYTLKADPDRDNNGPVIFQTQDTDLLDNDWVDFDIANDPQAIDADGDYVYTFSITLTNGMDSSNSFKIRTSQGVLEIDEIFTFFANLTGLDDLPIIYPQANLLNGIGPEDLVGSTYDGSFTFFFEIEETGVVELVFWDGDSDRGNFDGTQTDTDDPNTPNTIPAFSPPDTDVVPEGVNPPDPPDDIDPAGGGGFNIFFIKSPAVTYSIKLPGPTGDIFQNTNPSGNREWENFVLSTTSNDPNIVDANPSLLPPGTYQIRFEGLDMGNFVSVNPLFPIVIRGEVLPPDAEEVRNVPTMSEWGLIAVALFMGAIGVIAVRKKQQHS